jgi:hypothetical protein
MSTISHDPEFNEYEKYITEKNKKKEQETPESRDQRMRDQFQALEDAGFIKYIPNDSPMPNIGRRQPEPEPFKFDPESLEFEPEETSNIDEENLIWFGDPCYVVPRELWDPFCGLDSKHQYKVNYKNLPCDFFVWSTAYGDGEFDLKMNGEVIASLGVDAGMLSMIPMRLIKQWLIESGEKLGDIGPGYFGGGYALYAVPGELVVEKGNMSFDNITILTDW